MKAKEDDKSSGWVTMWSEVFYEGSGGFPILGKDVQREDDEDVTKGKEVDTQRCKQTE